MSLNNEPCIISPALINLIPLDFKYPFMISLDTCSDSFDDLSTKICVPSKTEEINVKVFNVITNKNKAKTMIKHISCGCKCKFNSAACNSN